MKIKLEDELRKSTDMGVGIGAGVGVGVGGVPGASEGEIARKKAESRLFGLSGAQSDRIRQEMARYATMRDPRLR